MVPPDHIAHLYSVLPTEFTAARNRLVAELRKSGRSVDARAVARLRKPSPALWAVNRLASTERNELGSFIGTVDRLRRAQLQDPRAVADALRAQRAALDVLVTSAKDLLVRTGLRASQPVLRRIADTLVGAAIDSQRAGALRRGQLTEELPAPGFEAFGGARVAASPLRLVRGGQAAPRQAPGHHAEQNARAAQADRQGRALGESRALEAEALERQAADHRRSVAQLEAESAAARAKLAEIDKRLRTARDAARQATSAANRAGRRSARKS